MARNANIRPHQDYPHMLIPHINPGQLMSSIESLILRDLDRVIDIQIGVIR